MPAVSKKQQQFFGMIYSLQKGEKVKGASPELKKTAKSISKKDAKDFASTKHKNLPNKVKKETVIRDPQSVPSVKARPGEQDVDHWAVVGKKLIDLEKDSVKGSKYAKKPTKLQKTLTRVEIKEALRKIYIYEKSRAPGDLLQLMSKDLKSQVSNMVSAITKKYNMSPAVAAYGLGKVIERQFAKSTLIKPTDFYTNEFKFSENFSDITKDNMKLKDLLKETELDKLKKQNVERLAALKLAVKAFKELGLSKKQSAYKIALRAIANAE